MEAESWAPGRNYRRSCPHPPSWRPQTGIRGGPRCLLFFLLSGLLSFVNFLVRVILLGPAWAEGKGELATIHLARTADRKRTAHTLAMIKLGRMQVMNKQKINLPGVPCKDVA